VFDIVTMDIEMPRMGGMEAIRLIKEFSPTTPVLALTGYASGSGLAERCRADKIFVKPIALSALEREVRALLRPNAVAAMSA
jgi:CheY-like chemotaxis protein